MIDAAGKLGGEDADRLDPQLAVLAHQLLKVPFGSFAVAHHQGGELGKGPAEIGIAVLRIAEPLALAVGELACGSQAAVGHEIRRRGKAPDAADLRRQDGRYYRAAARHLLQCLCVAQIPADCIDVLFKLLNSLVNVCSHCQVVIQCYTHFLRQPPIEEHRSFRAGFCMFLDELLELFARDFPANQVRQLVDDDDLLPSPLLNGNSTGSDKVPDFTELLGHDDGIAKSVVAQAICKVLRVLAVVGGLGFGFADGARISEHEVPAVLLEEVRKPVPVVGRFDAGNVRLILAESLKHRLYQVFRQGAVDSLRADGSGEDDLADGAGRTLFVDDDREPDVVAVEVDADVAAVGVASGKSELLLHCLGVCFVALVLSGLSFGLSSIDFSFRNRGQISIEVGDGIIHGDFSWKIEIRVPGVVVNSRAHFFDLR